MKTFLAIQNELASRTAVRDAKELTRILLQLGAATGQLFEHTRETQLRELLGVIGVNLCRYSLLEGVEMPFTIAGLDLSEMDTSMDPKEGIAAHMGRLLEAHVLMQYTSESIQVIPILERRRRSFNHLLYYLERLTRQKLPKDNLLLVTNLAWEECLTNRRKENG